MTGDERSMPGGDPAGTSSRRAVLIVEDDEDARTSLRMLVELQGYATIEAGDGESAVAHALARRPAAAVIDVGLPGMDGCMVARRIREALPGVPMLLIAMTGYHDLRDWDSAGSECFDVHLVKPIRFDRLFELLRGAPGGPR